MPAALRGVHWPCATYLFRCNIYDISKLLKEQN